MYLLSLPYHLSFIKCLRNLVSLPKSETLKCAGRIQHLDLRRTKTASPRSFRAVWRALRRAAAYPTGEEGINRRSGYRCSRGGFHRASQPRLLLQRQITNVTNGFAEAISQTFGALGQCTHDTLA